MAAAQAAGSSWSGGTWNGSSWSGSSWSGSSWSRQLLERQLVVRQLLVRQLLVRKLVVGQLLVGQLLVGRQLVVRQLVVGQLLVRPRPGAEADAQARRAHRRACPRRRTRIRRRLARRCALLRALAGLSAPTRAATSRGGRSRSSSCSPRPSVVHLYFRSEAHSLSLSEAGLVLRALLRVAARPDRRPARRRLARAAGVPRQRPLKVAFNLAQFALSSCVALLIFRALTDVGDIEGPVAWLAALAAAGACERDRSEPRRRRDRARRRGEDARASCRRCSADRGRRRARERERRGRRRRAARSATRGRSAPARPGVDCALALRAYADERRRHAHVDFLYQSMRAMQERAGVPLGAAGAARRGADDALGRVRGDRARSSPLRRADVCAARSSPTTSAARGHRAERAEDTLVGSASCRTTDAHPAPARPRDPRARRLPRRARPSRRDRHRLARATTACSASLLVGNRAGDVSTFNADDRKLFETFASHAARAARERPRQGAAALPRLPRRPHRPAEPRAVRGAVRQALARRETGLERADRALRRPRRLQDDQRQPRPHRRRRAARRGRRAAARRGPRRRHRRPARRRRVRRPAREPRCDATRSRSAERLVQALREPFVLHGHEMSSTRASASTGHVDTDTADELLAQRGRRDVRGEGQRQARLRVLRAADAHARPAAPRADRLARARDRALRDQRLLPADRLRSRRAGRSRVEALARWLHPGAVSCCPAASFRSPRRTG